MLSYPQLLDAQQRLAPVARRTPLLDLTAVPGRQHTRAAIKPECLQHTGSFKFRGAYNALAQLNAQQRAAGVVACSSGNHAQGVARAAQLLQIPATIIMPADAPDAKINRTRDYGAKVQLYHRERQDREQLTRDFAATSGAHIVWPYDDYDVMAGQGTCGLEMLAQLADQPHSAPLDYVLIPCGGGGLTAGVATAFDQLSPHTQVIMVEPEGFDDQARSLASGQRLRNPALAGSICDALLAPTPGELTFAINQRLVTGGVSVSDDQVRRAMVYAFNHLKLVVEPGGAVALAALLFSPQLQLHHCHVGVIVSGGNVDAQLFARIIAAGAPDLSCPS